MKRICAWCGKELGETEVESDGEPIISHGVCKDCAFHLTAQAGMKLRDFLEGLSAPVIAMDARGKVLAANEKAQGALGVELAVVEGKLCGDMFECVHATMPEGCGGTVHCLGCAIRRCVEETHATGESRDKVPAHISRSTPDDTAQIRYVVSTEKAGDIVLMRIDAVDKPAH